MNLTKKVKSSTIPAIKLTKHKELKTILNKTQGMPCTLNRRFKIVKTSVSQKCSTNSRKFLSK